MLILHFFKSKFVCRLGINGKGKDITGQAFWMKKEVPGQHPCI